MCAEPVLAVSSLLVPCDARSADGEQSWGKGANGGRFSVVGANGDRFSVVGFLLCASASPRGRPRQVPDDRVDAGSRAGHLAGMSTLADLDPKELRPLLHAEIDKLRDENLALAHRVLREIELQQVTDELDDAADAARAAGRLTPERIAEAIAAHRAAHPYR
jgi:hypothetical protein